MTTQFGSVLSNKPYVSAEAYDLPTDEKLRNKYMFHMSLLRGYIKYSQEVENQSKQAVQQRVNTIINTLVEKHKFGSKFVTDLNAYINKCYHKTSLAVYETMRNEASMEAAVFDDMMEDFKESPLLNDFSPQFQMILK